MDMLTRAVAVFLIFSFSIFPAQAKTDSGCMSCHNGIESIREDGSAMLALRATWKPTYVV